MDPLSIAASTAGLIGLTLTLIKTVNSISTAIARRPQLLAEVLDDLHVLRTVLEDLSNSDAGEAVSDAAALIAVLNGCKSVILQIDQQLDALLMALQQGRRSRAYAKLTFSSKMESIAALRNQLDKYKSTLIIALSLRTMKMASSSGLNDMINELRSELAGSSRKESRGGAWQNPIQLYLSASLGTVSPRPGITSMTSHPSNVSSASSTTLVDTRSASSGRENMSIPSVNTSSPVSTNIDFGTFDEWLTAFSPQENKEENSGLVKLDPRDTVPRITGPKRVDSDTNGSASDFVQFTVCDTHQPMSRSKTEHVRVRRTDVVSSMAQVLHKRGYERVCGFRCGNHFISPFQAHTDSVWVESVEGQSCYSMLKGLKISTNESLEAFYDNFIRVGEHDESIKTQLLIRDDSVTLTDGKITVDISFARTLRIPEDSNTYGAPVLFAPMPLFLVENYKSRLPPEIVQKGGIMLPLYQREALALNNKVAGPRSVLAADFAIKCLAGTVNVVSGRLRQVQSSQGSQEHIVVPAQTRLDGFVCGESLVKQFVAMPLGSGYTAEGQLTSKETFGGLQLIVAPKFRGRLENCARPHTAKLSTPGRRIRLTGSEFTKQSELLDRNHDLLTFAGNSLLSRVPQSGRHKLVHEMMLELASRQLEHTVLEPVYALDIRFELREGKSYTPVIGLEADYCYPIRWSNARKKCPPFTMKVLPFMPLIELCNAVAQRLNGQYVNLFHGEEQLYCPYPDKHHHLVHYSISQSCRLLCQLYGKQQMQASPQHRRIRMSADSPDLLPIEMNSRSYNSVSEDTPYHSSPPPLMSYSYSVDERSSASQSQPIASSAMPQSYSQHTPQKSNGITSTDMSRRSSARPVAPHDQSQIKVLQRPILADRAKYQFDADSEDEYMQVEIDDLGTANKRLHILATAMGEELDAENKTLGRIADKSDRLDDIFHLNTKRLNRIDAPQPAPSRREEKVKAQRWDMGLSAGGLIQQGIVNDPCPAEWNWSRACFINIQFVNSVIFERLTGAPPPPCPVTFKDYVTAGLPFYHLVQPDVIDGSKILATLKSVGHMDGEKEITISSKMRTDLVPTGCVLCEQNLTDTILRPCNHIFCTLCIRDTMMTGEHLAACGACGQKVNEAIGFSGPMEIPRFNSAESAGREPASTGTSTKASEAKALDDDAKSTHPPRIMAEVIELPANEFRSKSPSIHNGDVDTSMIVQAVRSGDLNAMQTLLGIGYDPNAEQLVHLAARLGRCNILFLLNDHGADINAVAEHTGYRPIHEAVSHGQNATILLLLMMGIDIETPTAHKDTYQRLTPLQVAAKHGHLRSLELLLSKGAKLYSSHTLQHDYITARDVGLNGSRSYTMLEVDPSQTTSLLHLAAMHGHEKVVAFLLGQGFNADHRCAPNAITPLLCASINSHFQVVKHLVDAGADVECEWQDCTPLALLLSHRPRPQDHVNEAILALLDAGAAPGTMSPNGMTLMHVAAYTGNTYMISFLSKRGDDVNISSRGKVAVNPLSVAFAQAQLPCCETLMSLGAILDSAIVEKLSHTLRGEGNPSHSTDVLQIADRWKEARWRRQGLHAFVKMLTRSMIIIKDVPRLFRALASLSRVDLICDIIEHYTRKDPSHQTTQDILNFKMPDLICQVSVNSRNAIAVEQLLAKVQSDLGLREWGSYSHPMLTKAIEAAVLRDDYDMLDTILSSLHPSVAQREADGLKKKLSTDAPQHDMIRSLLSQRFSRLARIV